MQRPNQTYRSGLPPPSRQANWGPPRNPQSKTWHSQPFRANRGRLQMNEARKRICPHSPFWPLDMDKTAHQTAYAALQEQEAADQAASDAAWRALSPTNTVAPISRLPFDGKIESRILTHEYDLPYPEGLPDIEPPEPQALSAVLALPTIFCTNWDTHKETIAPWPSKLEMDYEGDGRMATDALHARFPGLPRVPGNETVMWQQRALVPQCHFEDFYYPQGLEGWREIPSTLRQFLKAYWVDDLEFEGMDDGIVDEEGRHALGEGLLGVLEG